MLAAVWLSVVFSGLWVVWAYENRPGTEANPPQAWPAHSSLVPASDRPTLVFLAHPQCTCTRASIGELAEVLARTPNHPKTYVLFLRPSVVDADWEKTGLWRSAMALPDVTVLRDHDGVEARRFGVETSGQTLLYDAGGRADLQRRHYRIARPRRGQRRRGRAGRAADERPGRSPRDQRVRLPALRHRQLIPSQ